MSGRGARSRASDRRVLVTGASSGIGEACVLHLDALGYRVFAGVRSEQAAGSLRARASDRLESLMLDVTDARSVEEAARTVAAAVGSAGLWGVVNNAGIVVAGPLEHLTDHELRQQFDVNLFGQLAVTRAFLPLVRRGGGRIVNVGSICGRVPFPFVGPYGASKAALESMTRTLRMELRSSGIAVCLVEPGNVGTAIWSRSRERAAALMEKLPREAHELYGPWMHAVMASSGRAARLGLAPLGVARTVARALGSRHPRARYMVGWDARLLGLARGCLPAAVMERLVMGLCGCAPRARRG